MKGKSSWNVLALVLLFGFLLGQAQAAWVRKADVSGQPSGKPVKGGGSITAIGDIVYLVIGNNTNDVVKYDPGTNTWAALSSGIPAGAKAQKRAKKGACLADDESKVYAFRGGGTNDFASYDAATAAWAVLQSPGFTKGLKGGFATYANVSSTGYIYAGSGSNLGEWKRYNIGTGAWGAAEPAALPAARVKVGSALAFADGKMYFLLANTKEANFYVADLAASPPTWTAKQTLPLAPTGGKSKKVKEGGSLQFLGGTLYAVKGGSTTQFWSYDPPTDAWTYVGEVGGGAATKGIKCGTSLAAVTGGLYCIIGNNTNEFWYYSPTMFRAEKRDPAVQGAAVPGTRLAIQTTNPVSGAARVNCTLPVGTTAQLTVINALGSVVRTATSSTGSFGTIELAPGVYSLRVVAGGRSATSSLVVLK